MDRGEKQEKKKLISSLIDLGNGRFKDEEVDTLYDLCQNHEKYHGKSKTYKRSFTDWTSDGKYNRNIKDTFTFLGDDKGIRIKQEYSYKDDDGQSGSSETVITKARDILNALNKIF